MRYCIYGITKTIKEMRPMVSMKDIAAACGVSVATVSKALGGHTDISSATRELISEKAREMGYMANSAARALKTNRSGCIGVVFSDEGHRGLTHEFFAAVLDNFKVEIESHGYDMMFINRHVIGDTGYLQHCLYRGVDGVAVICVDYFDPEVQELVSSGLPLVTLDHAFNDRNAVISDNVGGTESLVSFAHSKGHTKIAYIHGERTAVTEQRLRGFYRSMEKFGLEIPEQYVISGRFYDAEGSYEAAKRLLDLPERPTCILFPDDFSLIGGTRAIWERGLRIPEDISVMGYDGIVVSQVMSPRITTFRQDVSLLGKTAARILLENIEHPKTALPSRIVVPGELIEGESVAEL